GGQRVEMGRRHVLAAVNADVAVAEVVGDDDENVGFGGPCRISCVQRCQGDDQQRGEGAEPRFHGTERVQMAATCAAGSLPARGANAVPMTSADVSSPRWDFKDWPRRSLLLDRESSRSARGTPILRALVRKHR